MPTSRLYPSRWVRATASADCIRDCTAIIPVHSCGHMYAFMAQDPSWLGVRTRAPSCRPVTGHLPFSLQILYNGQSVEVDGHSMRKLIADLQPNTEYSFVLMNRGSSAGGLQHLVSIRTAPDLLPHKPVPASAYMEDGRFTLSMPHVQDPSLIRCAGEALGRRTGLVTWAGTMTVLFPALPTQVVLHRGGAH